MPTNGTFMFRKDIFDLMTLIHVLLDHLSGPSLIEFFNKMKKWQDMANLAQEFRQSTNKLERNFTVSAVIFKKYVPIFKSIFKAPSEEPPRVHRSRKQRSDGVKCTFY